MKKYIQIAILVFPFLGSMAQQVPAEKQTKSILIKNAIAHLGNGEVIENAVVGFKEGKLTLVADAKVIRFDQSAYETVIDASGKHLYPGFIAPNSTLGLVEIDAVKSSDDERDLGGFTPHIRSAIAYNTESKIIETVRLNGILMAQVAPRGGVITGTSSVVQLDAWNWEQALVKSDDGLHMNFPNTYRISNARSAQPMLEANKDYAKQLDEIRLFFKQAKAYLAVPTNEKNLIFEATKGLFEGSQRLYITANEEKQIIDAVQLCQELSIPKIVIVGGYQANRVSGLLRSQHIPVLLGRTHSLPNMDQDPIDLPFKLAKILTDDGVVVGLENSGDMERMNTRNLPFQAGTCVAYGLTKEQALQLITSNTAKILGIDDQCGTLEVGKDATLFLSEGDALDMRTNIVTQAFIQGRNITLASHQTQLYQKYKSKYQQ